MSSDPDIDSPIVAVVRVATVDFENQIDRQDVT